jgi:hypothetical protein
MKYNKKAIRSFVTYSTQWLNTIFIQRTKQVCSCEGSNMFAIATQKKEPKHISAFYV